MARPLGPTGIRVSPLTLGTRTFSDGGWRAGEEQARAIFHRYLEAGGNSVDTANVYGGGRSEEILGSLIAETGSRCSLVLATKAAAPTRPEHPNSQGNGRKHLLSALEGSLRRLRTDYVDIFWLHLWDGSTPIADVMATLSAMVSSGKARTIGLSNVPAWYAAAAHGIARERGLEPPAALQMEYSLLERTVETEHLGAASQFGMSTVPWSPLANGFLSGKYNREGTSARGRLDPAASYPGRREPSDEHWDVLEAVRRSAQRIGCSPAQVALSWVMQQPTVTTTIIGATTVEQLDDNLRAASVELAPIDRQELDAASQPWVGSLYRLFRVASDVR